MWLIETSTLKLKFVTEAEKGSYAVLSHTWGEDEVSFDQFRNLDQAWLDDERQQKAFAKITKTCQLASEHGLPYAWVDTCCIDKTSSAELSEAINSMFTYYQNAAFCIALISDLPGAPENVGLAAHFESEFPRCRWLTRGWTLQELIAPPRVRFYDSTWTFRGTKHDWKPFLARETGVDETILVDSSGLRHIPVARRMSWASKRQTSRTEDMAYCLLGIFDVHMPLIYGEGRKAFMRLQEEIAKESCDLSLFAWQQNDSVQKYRGILATSVAEFSNCRELKHRIPGATIPTEFTLTNRGLRMETALVNVPSNRDNLILNLGVSFRDDWPIYVTRGWIGVHLAKTVNGFVRARPDKLFEAGVQGRLRCPPGLVHIRKTVDSSESANIERRFDRAIRVELVNSLGRPGVMRIERVAPEGLWVENHMSFLHQGRGINAYIRCEVRLSDQTLRPIIVACSTMGDPVCVIWHPRDWLWDTVVYFLDNCNERADFVAVDYLRVHFLSREDNDTSKATKHLESQEMENSISITAELKEDTDDEGAPRFVYKCVGTPPGR
ncbi:heterokaryon incompatibility protein-domain-containing protein [Nemania sp. FL0031]|nr:heterokaryon incompatibility protein-domain-containing protein [Nemania sp. FL0031]